MSLRNGVQFVLIPIYAHPVLPTPMCAFVLDVSLDLAKPVRRLVYDGFDNSSSASTPSLMTASIVSPFFPAHPCILAPAAPHAVTSTHATRPRHQLAIPRGHMPMGEERHHLPGAARQAPQSLCRSIPRPKANEDVVERSPSRPAARTDHKAGTSSTARVTHHPPPCSTVHYTSRQPGQSRPPSAHAMRRPTGGRIWLETGRGLPPEKKSSQSPHHQ